VKQVQRWMPDPFSTPRSTSGSRRGRGRWIVRDGRVRSASIRCSTDASRGRAVQLDPRGWLPAEISSEAGGGGARARRAREGDGAGARCGSRFRRRPGNRGLGRALADRRATCGRGGGAGRPGDRGALEALAAGVADARVPRWQSVGLVPPERAARLSAADRRDPAPMSSPPPPGLGHARAAGSSAARPLRAPSHDDVIARRPGWGARGPGRHPALMRATRYGVPASARGGDRRLGKLRRCRSGRRSAGGRAHRRSPLQRAELGVEGWGRARTRNAPGAR
jgi:hypothetical protein